MGETMKIQLKGSYRSVRAFIPEGAYEISDPILQGLGAYLLDTDHAYSLDAPKAQVAEEKKIDNLDLLKGLRNRYEDLTGKKAFNGWDSETLLTKIAELENPES